MYAMAEFWVDDWVGMIPVDMMAAWNTLSGGRKCSSRTPVW